MLRGVVGSLLTMAPEVIKDEFYNHKVDCWSLGVVLFQMLSYHLPFYDDNTETVKK